MTAAEHYREGGRLLELAEGTDLLASKEEYWLRADARQLAMAHFAAAQTWLAGRAHYGVDWHDMVDPPMEGDGQ